MSQIMIAPEGLEVANIYLESGSIQATAKLLCVSADKVVEMLDKAETKRYIDAVYLDLGYRNRNKMGALLDEMIESKLEEARDSEQYTSKDLVDLIQLSHKMRMEEIKAMQGNGKGGPHNQTNIQVNAEGSAFGEGNYGKLMERLLNGNIQKT